MQSIPETTSLETETLPLADIVTKPEQSAQVQGFICGLICGGLQSDGKPWIDNLLGTLQSMDSDIPATKTTLIDMYKKTSTALANAKFYLDAFLPLDQKNLTLRAQVLSIWCRGFIGGLEQIGLQIREEQSTEELVQAITRFNAISTINYEDIEIKKADEKAFNDVILYIQMAVIHIYNALNTLSPKQQKH